VNNTVSSDVSVSIMSRITEDNRQWTIVTVPSGESKPELTATQFCHIVYPSSSDLSYFSNYNKTFLGLYDSKVAVHEIIPIRTQIQIQNSKGWLTKLSRGANRMSEC